MRDRIAPTQSGGLCVPAGTGSLSARTGGSDGTIPTQRIEFHSGHVHERMPDPPSHLPPRRLRAFGMRPLDLSKDEIDRAPSAGQKCTQRIPAAPVARKHRRFEARRRQFCRRGGPAGMLPHGTQRPSHRLPDLRLGHVMGRTRVPEQDLPAGDLGRLEKDARLQELRDHGAASLAGTTRRRLRVACQIADAPAVKKCAWRRRTFR